MSNAGKGKPNRIPPTNTNGPQPMGIPEDLVWDEDNPPIIFPCSQHTEHAPFCNGNEPGIQLDSELQVNLMNEGRAWARAGMSFQGVPAAYQGIVPKTGIMVELTDLLCWLETVKELLVEINTIESYEFEEKFRETKLNFLREVRQANEANVRKQRVVDSLGVVQKPGLLGPDGNPI